MCGDPLPLFGDDQRSGRLELPEPAPAPTRGRAAGRDDDLAWERRPAAYGRPRDP